MTVTDQEARAITFLAASVRKTLHRAPTWDEAGIYDNVIRCREMSLPEVILRVIRAAADRDAATPGVIPKNGPHANEVLKAPKWEPTVIDAADRCSACSHHRHDGKCPKCAPNDDHAFSPDFRHKRSPEVAAEIHDALRDELAPMRDPAATRTSEPGAGKARLEESHE